MKDSFPSIETTQELIDEAAKRRRQKAPDYFDASSWRAHIEGVGKAAHDIAASLPDLDPSRARIMGLLHDIGKRWGEIEENTFHPLSGYYYMMASGFPAVARICLTHSYILQEDGETLSRTPEPFAKEAYAILKNFEYDDYDRLIQLADWLNDCGHPCTIEFRAASILKRYPFFSKEKVFRTAEAVEKIRSEFEKRTGKSIYSLTGISP